MDVFDKPSMKFHNFIRLIVFPMDFISTMFLLYNYCFKGQSFFSSPYAYAIYVLLAIKAVQTAVNVITQIGFVTYSGYSFYGIFAFFSLRILFYFMAYFLKAEPALGSLSDIVVLSLLSKYINGAVYEAILIVSMIGAIVLMGIITLYYFMRKDAFYFREPRDKMTKPLRDRNYPWKYNEKYKPYRKPRMSHRKLYGVKERRLDTVSGKEKVIEPTPEADVNEGHG